MSEIINFYFILQTIQMRSSQTNRMYSRQNHQQYHSLNQLPNINQSDYKRMTLRANLSMNKINLRGSMVSLKTSRLIKNLDYKRSSQIDVRKIDMNIPSI